MNLPPKKRPGNPVLASDWNTMVDALAARTPRPSATLEIVSTSGGFFYRARQTSSGSSTAVESTCPFGQIVAWVEGETSKTGIKGGVVYAGDKVWNVSSKELNLETTGTFLVWLEISVTANVEDGVLLPGLKTSTEPAWKQVTSTTGSNYPAQTIPTAPTGTGKAIVAVGVLTIKDGAATLASAGCGNIVVAHCPGSITFDQGGGGGSVGGSGGDGEVGPTGPMGPAGPTGPAGPRGATGATGTSSITATTTSTLVPGYLYVDPGGYLTTSPQTPWAPGETLVTLEANWHATENNSSAPTTAMDIDESALTLAPGNWRITGALLATSAVYSGTSAWFGIRFSGGAAVTNSAGSYTKWVPYCSNAVPAQPAATITVAVANGTSLANPIYYSAYNASASGQYHIMEVNLLVHVAVATSVRFLAGKVNSNGSYYVQGSAGETWLKATPV